MKIEKEPHIGAGQEPEPHPAERTVQELTVPRIILLVEFVALLIGLAMPITPSKTGGDFSFADWFFEDPSYLQEVFVYFVMTNLLIGILVLVAFVIIRLQNRGRGARS